MYETRYFAFREAPVSGEITGVIISAIARRGAHSLAHHQVMPVGLVPRTLGQVNCGGPDGPAPVSFAVGDRSISTSIYGALVPYDCLINPMVVPSRIGLGFLAAGGGLRYALLAPIPDLR